MSSPARPIKGAVFPGSLVTKDMEIETGAVIVGSGCAGAVVACELSQAHIPNVVLEEGRHVTREEYGRFTPSQSLRHLYRDYGASTVVPLGDTPPIFLLQGKCVGGSSVVNGGVCFRTPPYVVDAWREEHGLTEITHEEMEKAFVRVEKMLEVGPVPEELHNEGVRRLIAAAGRLGFQGHTIDRNVQNCDGCSRCIFGCPHDAKKNVLISYLARATKLGTRIFSETRARRIIVEGGRAVGIDADVVDPDAGYRRHRIRVRAKVVILAAGAIHTPLLLQRSRVALSSGQVGRNLTLHPAARAYGFFDDPVDARRGAMQSYVVDHFYKESLKLIGISVPTGILAATLPGFGQSHAELMGKAAHFAAFGAMISDVSTGQVRPGLFQAPLMTYRMLPEDKAKMVRAVKLVAKLWFEAGARRVYLPFMLTPELRSPDEIDRITPDSVPGRSIESSAQHPLGTCRMGKDPRRSVVGPWNEAHDVKNLFVVDASTVPSSVAVNPQITIMGLATRAAGYLVNEKKRYFAG